MSVLCLRSFVINLALLGAGSVMAETPIYRDKTRGVRKQREAADAAAKTAREGKERAAEVLELLADPSAWVRDRVVSEVVRGWPAEDIPALAAGLRDRRPLVVEGVAEIFAKKPGDKMGAALLSALGRGTREETAEVLLWAIGKAGSVDQVEKLERYFGKQKKSARLRIAVLHAISALSKERGQALAKKTLDDKLLPVRSSAMLLAAPEAALEGVAGFLEDPPKKKQVGAGLLLQRAARWVREFPAEHSAELGTHRDALARIIEQAIDRLDDLEGRTKSDWIRALSQLTGQRSMGADSVRWKAWWKQKGDEWQPAAPSSGSNPKGEGGNGKPKKPQTSVIQFHGLEVDSERLVFLHDLSGGMSRNLDGNYGDQSGKTRLDYAKAELERVLRVVPKDSWLNVVFFASEFISFKAQPQLVKKARRKILSFVAEQQIPGTPHSNRGNLYDSLVFVTRQPHVDTIFLFTEGAPTEGKYIDYDRFLEHYERVLRTHPVRVHVLSLGKPNGRNRSFLEKLAKLTDGRYREVVGNDEG